MKHMTKAFLNWYQKYALGNEMFWISQYAAECIKRIAYRAYRKGLSDGRAAVLSAQRKRKD